MKMKWLAALLLAVVCQAQQRIPILFDTDIGDDVDDALALALALQSPELDVRAVTTVNQCGPSVPASSPASPPSNTSWRSRITSSTPGPATVSA